MIVKLLTEHHLEFLSLTGGCIGSSKSTHVKMPHCWKSHATVGGKPKPVATIVTEISTVLTNVTLKLLDVPDFP